ncbi:MAG: hypothetical protein AAGB22_08845, partial [Bacteroidota bacterium]
THFFVDIADSHGQVVSTIRCKRHDPKPSRFNWSRYGEEDDLGITRFKLSHSGEVFLTTAAEGLRIFDLSGNVLHAFDPSETFHHINFLNFRNALWLRDSKGEHFVYDWQNGERHPIPSPVESGQHVSYGEKPDQPVLVLHNPEAQFFLLWNWDRNTFTKHRTDSPMGHLWFHRNKGGTYIRERYYNSRFERLWDEHGNEIMRLGHAAPRVVTAWMWVVDSGNYLISYTDSLFRVHASDGSISLEKDRSEAAYTSFSAHPIAVHFYRSNGVIERYRPACTLENTLQLDPWSKFGVLLESSDTAIVLQTPFVVVKSYSPQGKLMANFGRYHPSGAYRSSVPHYQCWGGMPESGIVRLNQAPESPHHYQLVLHNKERQFIGTVTLDYATKKAFEAYQQQYLKNYRIRKQREAARQQQAARLVRSFSVQQFGIYNWDRMYKEPGAVLCKARIQVEGTTGDEAFNVFLITGDQRNTVVKYAGTAIDKFAFQPSAYNQLLVVMPDDRVALMSNEAFQALDLTGLTEATELVLPVQTLGKAESLEYLEELLAPEAAAEPEATPLAS